MVLIIFIVNRIIILIVFLVFKISNKFDLPKASLFSLYLTS
jgi:hypothetical protein